MAKRVEVIDISKVKNKDLISTDLNGNIIQINPINPEKLPMLEHERDQMIAEVIDSKFRLKKPFLNPDEIEGQTERMLQIFEHDERFTEMVGNHTGDDSQPITPENLVKGVRMQQFFRGGNSKYMVGTVPDESAKTPKTINGGMRMSIKDYVKLKQTEHSNVAQTYLNHLNALYTFPPSVEPPSNATSPNKPERGSQQSFKISKNVTRKQSEKPQFSFDSSKADPQRKSAFQQPAPSWTSKQTVN